MDGHQLAQGTVVAGRYAVVRLLGRGASKEVYLADDRLSGTQVALALLIGEFARDPTLAARFSREGRAAAAIRSQHVARVFDAGKLVDGTRYLAIEAVLGRGLDDAMACGPVAPDQAARWTLHVLAGLTAAHARNILHRDVKPENVLLAPSPEGEIAKLTDFGLAKVLDGSIEGSVMLRTAQNVVLGTPEYMPPEQWRGEELDVRADVYATGVMLYEMLLGRCPFESRVLHALCLAHVTQPPPPFPPDAFPAVRALEPVVMRALAKSREDRFASASEMAAAIASIANLAHEVPVDRTEPVPGGRSLRAELVCDAWPGAVRLLAGSDAVLGRDAGAHVVARCLPVNSANESRNQTVARLHARIEWRGGHARVMHLGEGTTTVQATNVPTGTPVPLRHGDELALGPHVRFVFEHAACASGELPRWARLTRLDDFGSGQVTVLVLTEARVSGAIDAAVRVPPSRAAGDMLRIRAEGSALTVLTLGAPDGVPLHDGQVLRLGNVQISVAMEG